MVTAGVYLLMRSSPLIEYSSTVLMLCLWLGAITTVFSSLIGLFQQDIKKVIAYSTMSQLAREFFKFRHQTICVEVIILIINSQITKARDIYHINYNLFNSFTTMWLHNIMFEKRKVKIIRKLVGISEAIRLILIFLNLTFLGLNSYNLSPARQLTETHKLYKSSLSLNDINNPTLGTDSSKFNEWVLYKDRWEKYWD